MTLLDRTFVLVLKHPLHFLGLTLKGFSRNQGLLLAGAIAYYALLSLVPLLILAVIVLSRVIDEADLLRVLAHYLEWLVPSQSKAFLVDLSQVLDNRLAIGAVLLITMLFFSSVAFSALEKAMAVIFSHRAGARKRHALVSVLLPYCFVLLLGSLLFTVTLVSIGLQALAQESINIIGHTWSLRGVSGLLLYLLGLATEILILTAVYYVIPVGRLPLRHALIGGITATFCWEIIRHVLVWYFTTLSKASIVYGSLTTAVVALFSMEIAATVLLFGAQVISEYERMEV
ncbi:MAG TPA: YihY/virulence factor BrkB family protein [Rhodocyclaceae bacterium]|nr:YihY/virulence factor BrkB family protein [Rhodocyclaceae bacterium]